jgi:hypothetical protein
MLISRKYSNLIALGSGILASILGLELIMQLLPVKSDRQFAENTIAEPVIRGKADSIVEPIDWKFSQTYHRKVNNYGFVDDRDYQPNSSPVAVIGDSYIQSAMLPYKETIQGQLSQKIGNQIPVYSFGTPMHSLAGYLGAAEYADRQFKPTAYVFLLNKGDIIDSLQSQSGSYFLDRPDGELKFEEAKVSRKKTLIAKSALYRYLYRQIYFNPERVVSAQFKLEPPPKPKVSAATYQQISGRLLELLATKTQVKPQNTIFIVDSDRNRIYNSQLPPDREELSVFKQVAIDRGYQVIETEDLFANYYKKTNRKVDFLPTDFHWNAIGNQLVADRVHPVLTDLLAKLPIKDRKKLKAN